MLFKAISDIFQVPICTKLMDNMKINHYFRAFFIVYAYSLVTILFGFRADLPLPSRPNFSSRSV